MTDAPIPPEPYAEPYIPVRVAELIELLLTEAGAPEYPAPNAAEAEQFRGFARAVAGRMHAGFRAMLTALKDLYTPFDPDRDTHSLRPLSEVDRRFQLGRLFDTFVVLLTRAGFHRMTRPEVEETIRGASHWGVEMDVCWDVFERAEVFYRGKGTGTRTRTVWWKLFKPEDVALPTFRRVVIVLKQQPHPRLGNGPDVRNVYVKLFKDIPQMDLEMLLPGARLVMPRLAKGKLGGSALGSVAYVIYKLATTLSVSKLLGGGLLAFYSPLTLILGYGYKTVYSYQAARRTYMLHLTQSLYFQSLDTNAGVLFRLFDDAEEQDLRQVLLAYYFLWRFAGPAGWGAAELDRRIESDLEKRLGEKVEMGTDEALERLVRYGVVKKVGATFVAVAAAAATESLVSVAAKSEPDRPSGWKGVAV